MQKLALGLALLLLPTAVLRADEYDDLRLKWRDTVAGAGYDTADPEIVSKLTSIANSANSAWNSMDKSATRTFLWSDAASTTVSAHLTTNYGRLRSMALAWATSGCSLHGNATLLADTIGGLEWMNANRYKPTSTQYDNWWDWEIGSPLHLTDIAVLLYDQLTATQRANYMAAVEKQTPTPDMTGANQVWKARVVGVRGCVVKSATKLAAARDAFTGVFPYVTSGDGFYTDGSFLQHNRHPYTGGYGASLLGNMAPLLNWLSGSTWEVTNAGVANVYRWVFEAYEPLIYRGAVWDFVRGREISRSGGSPQGVGQSFMDSILQIAQFAPAADAARMRSMLKGIALSDTVRDFVTSRGLPTITLAKQLMADASVTPRPELAGHWHFAAMDRVVHLQPGYGFGLSMCSSRIYNFESINGENLHGWFTGDGMTYLYNADLTQYAGGFWATVDPYRLPGVTADPTHVKEPPNPGNSTGSSAKFSNALSVHNWVGGATLSEFGAAGMQLDGAGVTLTGKKSWFMFDDEVVCLGAGITSTDARPIETTVENRRLNAAGSNRFTVNGTVKPVGAWNEAMTAVSWAHLAGSVSGADIGYYFPQPAAVRGVREARTGAWADIDEGASASPITNTFLRMTVEHGSNPVNATYQYVLLPGRTVRHVGHYVEAPQVSVLANDGNVQAARETTLGITAANFWTDTTQTAGIVTVNRKASVLVRDDGTFLDVSVSDPTQANTGTITLQLAATGTLVSADAGVSVTQSAPSIAMTVDVSGARGKTFRARFYLRAAETVTLAPVADAYVQDGTSADTNFGTSGSLVVKKGSANFNRESFLRFDVPAASGVQLGAMLRLVPTLAQVPGAHGVEKVSNDAWIESGAGGITWNTKPASSGTLLSTWTPAQNVATAADVRGAIAGSGLVSLRVYSTTATSDGYVDYASRSNATTANRPQLVLTIGHTPPSVAITSPAEGEFLPKAGATTITADAEATDGAVTSVAFYDGATLLGTDSAEPYAVTVNLGGGAHLLRAVATDANGLIATSLTRRIDVANPPTAAAASRTTPTGTAVDIDLRPLAADAETPAAQLRLQLGAATGGSVTLLADGDTARFTPTAGYTGPASFSYSVTDTAYDGRALLHYPLQGDVNDATGQDRSGTLNVQGTGAAAYTSGVPAALASLYSQSLALTETGTGGAARLERQIPSAEFDLRDGDWTIAGWFRRATAANQDTILQIGDSGGYASNAMTLAFYGSSSTLELKNFNGSTQDIALSKATVATGQWHHFALVRSGATLSWYHNGALAGSDAAFAFSFGTSPTMKFGGVVTSVLDRWLNGSLVDLAIFSAPLGAAEVAALTGAPVVYLAGQTTTGTVSIAVLSAIEQWRQQHFGTTTATGTAADDADPNRDGIVNKLEFFLARNPLTQNPASSLPSIVRKTSTLEYTYTRSVAAAAQLADAVEWSDTLAPGSWSTAGVTEQVLSDNGTVQQVRAVIPTGSSGRRFIRLQVQ